MIEIDLWMEKFSRALETTFPGRVWFVGLQGSYARGEANEASDLDVVAILDRMEEGDLSRYRDMLDALPYREKICGFFSDKARLLAWEPAELFQFYYDTRPIRGSLDALLEKLDRQAVTHAIRLGACSLYHACAHNFLHELDTETLAALYKAAVFIVRATVFDRTGRYARTEQELAAAASEAEIRILKTRASLKNGGAVDLDAMSAVLIDWTGKLLETYPE